MSTLTALQRTILNSLLQQYGKNPIPATALDNYDHRSLFGLIDRRLIKQCGGNIPLYKLAECVGWNQKEVK